MLKNNETFGSFSVNNADEAKDFYTNKLGLEVEEFPGREGMFFLKLGGDKTNLVYSKPDHTPATFTILNFTVDNIENAVGELKGKGVTFEKYDGEMKTDENGIWRRDGIGAAWFKDPSGNVLSVIENK